MSPSLRISFLNTVHKLLNPNIQIQRLKIAMLKEIKINRKILIQNLMLKSILLHNKKKWLIKSQRKIKVLKKACS